MIGALIGVVLAGIWALLGACVLVPELLWRERIGEAKRERCPCSLEHCERAAMGDPEGRCPGLSCAWWPPC